MTQKLRRLVDALLRETEADRLKWSAVGDDSFRTEVASALFRITRTTKQHELDTGEWVSQDWYNLVVTSPDGSLAEDIEVTLDSRATALFQAARRAAHDTDTLLERMLRSLEPVASK